MLDTQKILQMGLNPQRIGRHAQRLNKNLNMGKKPHIYVEKPCTVSNGGILATTSRQLKKITSVLELEGEPTHLQWQIHHTITLFPAAGAASRFFAPLTRFLLEVQHTCPTLITALVRNPKGPGAQWQLDKNQKKRLLRIPLPPTPPSSFFENNSLNNMLQAIQKLLGASNRYLKFAQSLCFAHALTGSQKAPPKALAPATNEGDTFLCTKILEQLWTFPCKTNLIICPLGARKNFLEHLGLLSRTVAPSLKHPPWFFTDKDNTLSNWVLSWEVLEQEASLNTLRFSPTGTPWQDTQGHYSPVAAGHGELLHLFEDIANAHPQATCLHIRNLDNIIGAKPITHQDILAPSQMFWALRHALEILRHYAGQKCGHFSSESLSPLMPPQVWQALHILKTLSSKRAARLPIALNSTSQYPTGLELWQGVQALFHGPKLLPGAPLWDALYTLLQKPLSVFGVVKKRDGDIGGGPVFATLEDGQFVKMCLEMPHVQDNEKDMYFGENGLAQHFNPVIVFFELRKNGFRENGQSKQGEVIDFKSLYDDRLWLMAEKDFGGQKVVYHETVLYELLGNSAQTNTVFLEVPRRLFHPHKTLKDTQGKRRDTFGFEKIFTTPPSPQCPSNPGV